jgi:hypothetical protein
MASARKLIGFDWAMKRLLRSKANFDILRAFYLSCYSKILLSSKFSKVKATKNQPEAKPAGSI